jgi:hypothetical protein
MHPALTASRGLALLILLLSVQLGDCVTSAISFQGLLSDRGQPANGNYDLTFSLFNTPTGGSQVGGTITNLSTTISSGLFTVNLDFGAGIFTGQDLWIEIEVRCSGCPDNYTLLAPRQPICSVPYAQYSVATPGSTGSFSRRMQVFTNSAVFTPPSGLSNVIVEAWGGGGGGGAGSSYYFGGGGGGGGYGKGAFALTPGLNYVITVGEGGVGSTLGANNATVGGDTSFAPSGSAPMIIASGGSAGSTAASNAQGTPGTSGSSNGPLNVAGGYAGGNGGAGGGGGGAGGVTSLLVPSQRVGQAPGGGGAGGITSNPGSQGAPG